MAENPFIQGIPGHGVTFGTKHSWNDWHLVPTSRPVFNPPEFKTNYVDIPGGYGKIDLSTYMNTNNAPMFENRIGSIEFIVVNGYGEWYERYSEIMNYLHGKKLKAILDDDPQWYYEGRFTVNSWKPDKNWSIITIDYDVYPFKKEITASNEEWLWDPFDFENGVINSFKNVSVNGTQSFTIIGTEEISYLSLTVFGTEMQCIAQGKTFDLSNGINDLYQVRFSGEFTFQIKGTGTVTVNYRRGLL